MSVKKFDLFVRSKGRRLRFEHIAATTVRRPFLEAVSSVVRKEAVPRVLAR